MGIWQTAISSIFKTVDIKGITDKLDDRKLTSEESMKYYMEWMSIKTGEGFKLAQRLIGVSFTYVFLSMVSITFILLAASCIFPDSIHNIEMLKVFIGDSMANPMMIILGVYFGGGFVNSIKAKK
ncbi:MAG: hypothetical protein KAH32_04120 [Chlamydiia bacterium]|nr:hypothetical protein [Chlamydiia bacterium]